MGQASLQLERILDVLQEGFPKFDVTMRQERNGARALICAFRCHRHNRKRVLMNEARVAYFTEKFDETLAWWRDGVGLELLEHWDRDDSRGKPDCEVIGSYRRRGSITDWPFANKELQLF